MLPPPMAKGRVRGRAGSRPSRRRLQPRRRRARRAQGRRRGARGSLGRPHPHPWMRRRTRRRRSRRCSARRRSQWGWHLLGATACGSPWTRRPTRLASSSLCSTCAASISASRSSVATSSRPPHRTSPPCPRQPRPQLAGRRDRGTASGGSAPSLLPLILERTRSRS